MKTIPAAYLKSPFTLIAVADKMHRSIDLGPIRKEVIPMAKKPKKGKKMPC